MEIFLRQGPASVMVTWLVWSVVVWAMVDLDGRVRGDSRPARARRRPGPVPRVGRGGECRVAWRWLEGGVGYWRSGFPPSGVCGRGSEGRYCPVGFFGRVWWCDGRGWS
jgi:hypothetical protein